MKTFRMCMLAPVAICLLPLLHGCGGNATPETSSASNSTTETSNTASTASTDTTSTNSSAVSIATAEMSRDHDGKDLTTTFKPTDMPVYTQIKLSGPGNGAKVKAAYTVVDAGGQKNLKFKEADLVASGTSDTLTFKVSLAKGEVWDKGAFKTDIYVNGKLAKSLSWTVE